MKQVHLKTRKIIFNNADRIVEVWRMSAPSRRSTSSFAGYWPIGKPRKLSYTSKEGRRYLSVYYPEMLDVGPGGLHIKYLPANQAWAVMWMDQILSGGIWKHKKDAEAHIKDIQRRKA